MALEFSKALALIIAKFAIPDCSMLGLLVKRPVSSLREASRGAPAPAHTNIVATGQKGGHLEMKSADEFGWDCGRFTSSSDDAQHSVSTAGRLMMGLGAGFGSSGRTLRR